MPLNKDIKKVLVIGSGPIVIGQAAEFDYSGTQACQALKEEGIEVVLVNSNPATIMTDREVADKIYIEPLTLKIVEKVNLDDKYVQNTVPGDIVANKNGIITKIVVENGTALLKEGSYVENGNIVIEGVMYSKILEPTLVPAKGVVLINSNNEFKKEYKYEEIVKNYTGKKRYTIGITINSKENMLNYLNKDKKYDITKNSKTFNLFGNVISLDFYECNEYTETIVTRTKEELVDIATKESKEYINTQVIPNLKNAKLVSEDYIVEDIQDGISFTNKYVINEEIGIFRER